LGLQVVELMKNKAQTASGDGLQASPKRERRRILSGRAILHWTRRTRIRRKRLSPARTTTHPPAYFTGFQHIRILSFRSFSRQDGC